MKRLLFALPALAFAVSACGGAHTQSMLPQSAAPASVATRAALSVSLTMPKANRRIDAVCFAAQSQVYQRGDGLRLARLHTDRRIAGLANVRRNAGSGSCPTTGGTTTCTFALNVPFTSASAVSGMLVIDALDASSVVLLVGRNRRYDSAQRNHRDRRNARRHRRQTRTRDHAAESNRVARGHDSGDRRSLRSVRKPDRGALRPPMRTGRHLPSRSRAAIRRTNRSTSLRSRIRRRRSPSPTTAHSRPAAAPRSRRRAERLPRKPH